MYILSAYRIYKHDDEFEDENKIIDPQSDDNPMMDDINAGK